MLSPSPTPLTTPFAHEEQEGTELVAIDSHAQQHSTHHGSYSQHQHHLQESLLDPELVSSSPDTAVIGMSDSEQLPLRIDGRPSMHALSDEPDADDDSSRIRGGGIVREALCSGPLIRVLLIGQLLSLLVTGTGVFSQLLSGRNSNIPTSQSFANYIVLSLCLVPQLRRWWDRRGRRLQRDRVRLNGWDSGQGSAASSGRGGGEPSLLAEGSPSAIDGSEANASSGADDLDAPFLQVAWWKYFLLALADVEGNFFLVKAYEYTSITSVQLLDCFTIPLVMLFSRLALKTNYNSKHLLGAGICLAGLTLLIASDLLSKRNEGATVEGGHILLGDSLVLLGCICYAVSNLGQEYFVKKFDRFEFLGMLGVWGSIISAIQMAAMETQALKLVDWTDPVVLLYLLGFNVCLFSLYYLTPILLEKSSALFLNLSFLTSDFWSLLVAVVLFHARLHALYFAAFSIIIVGLLMYNLAGVEWDECLSPGGQRGDLSAKVKHIVRQICGNVGQKDQQGGGGEGDEEDEEDQQRSKNDLSSSGGGRHAYSAQLDDGRADERERTTGSNGRTSSRRVEDL